jgi:O-antigen ligase
LDLWSPNTVYRNIGRVVATFENPNHFGSFLACCLPIAVAILYRLDRMTSLWMILCGVCYIGMLLSGSRGAYIAGIAGVWIVVVGVGFQAWRRKEQSQLLRFAILGMTLILITFWYANDVVIQTPSQELRIGERLLSSKNIVESVPLLDVGVHHRYWIWKITWDMIQDAPVFGHGYGMFEERFTDMRGRLQERDLLLSILEDVSFAHNEYLHIWVEGGLFGLFGLFGVVSVVIINALKRVWSDDMWLEVLGGLGLVVAMLTHSLVSYPLHLELNSMVFWLTLGILARAGFVTTSDE